MYILGLLCLFSSYGEKFLIFIKIIMWPNIKISMFLLPFKHTIKVNLILYKHNFKIPYRLKCRQRDEWKNEQTHNISTCVCISHSVMFDSLWPHRRWPAKLLRLWDSPGKNTGMDCHSLLQRNFPTQGSNPGLLSHRQILYRLSYREVL